LLNKLSVTQLAELSDFSKSYISQVKHGKRPPSKQLLDSIANYAKKQEPEIDYFDLFLQSRMAMGVTAKTLRFYRERLSKYIAHVNYLKATRRDIERYLNTIPPNQYGLATRHASFRAAKTFHRWLESEYRIANPIAGMRSPILAKAILPCLSRDQILYLIDQLDNIRDKSIVALFAESGLRLSELSSIKAADIDWGSHTIKIWGKGRKQQLAPFGQVAEKYLREWLSRHNPGTNDSIWGINEYGIKSMLRRLKDKTNLACNAHVFRRSFAVLLRQSGLDTMTIRDLGRWTSLSMVSKYTQSITFNDSLKFYKPPLS